MDKIADVAIVPCTNSRYIQPYRVTYKQDDQQKFWDCIKMHDSIGILIFNKTRKTFVLVKQFRPAVYMSQHKPLWENSEVFTAALSQKPSPILDGPPSKRSKGPKEESDGGLPLEYGHGSGGCTYELCAGIVDKKMSLEQMAKEEILEETGYDVPVEKLEFINSFYSSIGTGGTRQSTFYCEVTDDMSVTRGGGVAHEGEMIDVIHVPIDEATEFVFDTSKPKSAGLCFAVLWFERFKRPHLKL